MNTIFSVACLAGVLVLSSAHLCLISPQQRGSLTGLNKEGSDDCILLKKPCGGRDAQMPGTTFMSGKNATVIFQKNLDHWTSGSPGYFAVNIMTRNTTKEFARVVDKGEKSLTLYTVTGTVPSGMTGKAVLQATYVTKNPKAPPVFYQCADIYIQ